MFNTTERRNPGLEMELSQWLSACLANTSSWAPALVLYWLFVCLLFACLLFKMIYKAVFFKFDYFLFKICMGLSIDTPF